MKEPVFTKKAPEAIGPYSQGITWENLVFVSGQIALNPKTGFVEGDVKEQTEQILNNLSAVLEAAGSGLKHVLKTTVFLADMNDFGSMNEVYGRFFGDVPPARSTIEVSKLPKNAKVEIEAVAGRAS